MTHKINRCSYHENKRQQHHADPSSVDHRVILDLVLSA